MPQKQTAETLRELHVQMKGKETQQHGWVLGWGAEQVILVSEILREQLEKVVSWAEGDEVRSFEEHAQAQSIEDGFLQIPHL